MSLIVGAAVAVSYTLFAYDYNHDVVGVDADAETDTYPSLNVVAVAAAAAAVAAACNPLYLFDVACNMDTIGQTALTALGIADHTRTYYHIVPLMS
jgi:hypothetical protein